MAVLSLEQNWELMNGEKLSCREVFSKLKAKELDKTLLCRSEKSRKWKEVSTRFRIIRNFGILHSVGQGGFGKVYKAVDINNGRIVALKVPTDNVLTNFVRDHNISSQKSEQQAKREAKAKIGQMFSQEVALTARLSMCPHVVSVIDHCIHVPYIAIEFCNGGTLTQRMKEPYTVEDILEWSYQIAKALDAAHTLRPDRLIHRDLKPSNVLLHDNVLKVSDFGTSKMSYDSKSLQSLDGGYTPFYAAPEAFDGKATCATDIWSFGVMLYVFSCHEYPFQGNATPELIMKINFKEPTPLNEAQKENMPMKFIELVERCLQKKACDRPEASECVAVLHELLYPQPVAVQQKIVEPTLYEEPQSDEESESKAAVEDEEHEEEDEDIDFGSLGW